MKYGSITHINELTKNQEIMKRACVLREESEKEEARQTDTGRYLVDQALTFDESIIRAYDELYVD